MTTCDDRFTPEQLAAAQAARDALPAAQRRRKAKAQTDAQKALRSAISRAKAQQTRDARKATGA